MEEVGGQVAVRMALSRRLDKASERETQSAYLGAWNTQGVLEPICATVLDVITGWGDSWLMARRWR